MVITRQICYNNRISHTQTLMTAAAYTEAVRSMTGLPPHVTKHLLSLAERLTDEQRKGAIEKLQDVHSDILDTGKKIVDAADEGEREIEHFERVEVPRMHQEIEQSEHQSAEDIFKDDSSVPPAQ